MKVTVVGCGASGMMAAIAAAEAGHEVTVLERNEKAGKKIYITGKGRCNLTNACPSDELMKHIVTNPRFMYSALDAFNNDDIIKLMNDEGVATKVERGERVFPVSNHASDVIKALVRSMDRLGVTVRFNTYVKDLDVRNGCVLGVVTSKNEHITSDRVILATGGASYPTTGSDGSSYKLAETAGHTIVPVKASLVPLICSDDWMGSVQGLSLKNVRLIIFRNGKKINSDIGEMLFTGKGISGPLVLSASAIYEPGDEISIDLKPGLDENKLDERIIRDFKAYSNKDFLNSLNDLLPKSLIPVIVALSGIPSDKKVHQITGEERKKLVSLIKDLKVCVTHTGGFDEAIITRGGINVKEIDPSTMQSKVARNLSFAGEMIDVDALTGGFNLQIAWSTGYLAGQRTGW